MTLSPLDTTRQTVHSETNTVLVHAAFILVSLTLCPQSVAEMVVDRNLPLIVPKRIDEVRLSRISLMIQ
jgi:hypothetical protein